MNRARPLLTVALLLQAACATSGITSGNAPRSVGRASYQEGGDGSTTGKRRFWVEVFEDGTVSFEGTECVPALGRQMKTLSNDRRRQVARLFRDDCAAVTPQEAHCARGDTIRIVCGGVEKFEQTTCENAPPPHSLEELLAKLVDAAELQEWVGPREHKCKGR